MGGDKGILKNVLEKPKRGHLRSASEPDLSSNTSYIPPNSLVALLEKSFPHNSTHCKDLDVHAKILMKVMRNSKCIITPETTQFLIDLFLKFPRYQDDSQLCICALYLFKETRVVELNKDFHIISVIKVLSSIMTRYKENIEIIGLVLEISQQIFDFCVSKIVPEIFTRFIFEHFQLLESRKSEVRHFALKFFKNNVKHLKSLPQDLMLKYFNSKFKLTFDTRVLDLFLRLVIIYVSSKNCYHIFFKGFSDILFLASYSSEIMILTAISNNLHRMKVFGKHLVDLFHIIIKLEMYHSDEYAIHIVLRIFMFIFRETSEIKKSHNLKKLLDFLNFLFTHHSRKVHNMASESLFEVLDSFNCEIIYSEFLHSYIDDIITSQVKLFKESYMAWENSAHILGSYINFLVKHSLFQQEKILYSSYFQEICQIRMALKESDLVSFIDEIIIYFVCFTGVGLFMKEVELGENIDQESCDFKKWCFDIILSSPVGYQLSDWVPLFKIFKSLYYNRTGSSRANAVNSPVYCSLYPLVFPILVKYSKVLSISFMDVKLAYNTIKDIFLNDRELRNEALDLISHLKVEEKTDDPIFWDLAQLLLNLYFTTKKDEILRKHIISALKSVFNNFEHQDAETFYSDVISLYSNTVQSNFCVFQDLIKMCSLFVSHTFAIKLLINYISAPFTLNLNVMLIIKNLVSNLTFPKCQCCSFESFRHLWFEDFISFMNIIMENDVYEFYPVIMDLLKILSVYLPYEDVLYYMDYVCKTLLNFTPKLKKKYKLFMDTVLGNHVIDDDSLRSFLQKLLDLCKNTELKCGSVYLITEFIKYAGNNINKTTYSVIFKHILELVENVNEEQYKHVLKISLFCLPDLDYECVKSFYLETFKNPKHLKCINIGIKLNQLVDLSYKYLKNSDIKYLKNNCETFKIYYEESNENLRLLLNEKSESPLDENEQIDRFTLEARQSEATNSEKEKNSNRKQNKVFTENKERKKTKHITFDKDVEFDAYSMNDMSNILDESQDESYTTSDSFWTDKNSSFSESDSSPKSNIHEFIQRYKKIYKREHDLSLPI